MKFLLLSLITAAALTVSAGTAHAQRMGGTRTVNVNPTFNNATLNNPVISGGRFVNPTINNPTFTAPGARNFNTMGFPTRLQSSLITPSQRTALSSLTNQQVTALSSLSPLQRSVLFPTSPFAVPFNQAALNQAALNQAVLNQAALLNLQRNFLFPTTTGVVPFNGVTTGPFNSPAANFWFWNGGTPWWWQ
jgi:hypothetical protein